MIDQDRRDKALTYLIETDEKAALARANMLGLEKQEKTILGLEILDQKGKEGTVPEKEAKARNSTAYKEWQGIYEDAVADFEIYRNRRKTAELVIECWRSENANRRHGNI